MCIALAACQRAPLPADAGAPTDAAVAIDARAPIDSGPPPTVTTDSYDGTLLAPVKADVIGITAHQAWLGASGPRPYTFLVDLDSGCVTSTFERSRTLGLSSFATHSLHDDADYDAALARADVRADIAQRLALLERLGLRTDGVVAISPDHQRALLAFLDRLYILDVTRPGIALRHYGPGDMQDVERVTFLNDQAFTFAAVTLAAPGLGTCVGDVLRLDAPPTCFDSQRFEETGAITEAGRPLFVGDERRCIYELDVTAAPPAMERRICFATPKETIQPGAVWLSPRGRVGLLSQVDAVSPPPRLFALDGRPPRPLGGRYDGLGVTVGPDDSGRLAWSEGKRDVWHVLAPGVAATIPTTSWPIAFLPDGRLLSVRRPPNNAPLDAMRCSLVYPLDPKDTKSP